MPSLLENLSIGFLIHFVLMCLTIPRILTIKRDPKAAIAWIFWVLLVPVVGSLSFWSIGDPGIREPTRRIEQGPIHRSSQPVTSTTRKRAGFMGLQRMMARLDETPSTEGNHVDFYVDGRRAFDAMEKAILEARYEVCFQFFIIQPDECGQRFADLLIQKAQEGVDVYFLFDAIGSKKLKRRFIRRLRAGGVECHPFMPLSIFRRRFQLNFRNHRKLVIIDRKIAFTGGLNIGREYVGRSKWAGHWFDAHVRIEGPAVPHLLEEFAADWAFVKEEKRTFLETEADWFEEPEPLLDVKRESRGWVQTVSSGPDQRVNRMRSMIFFAATRARRRLWIASPYFVPDEALLTSLTTAAMSGVDVRLLTQNNRPDHWLPYFAARYIWEDLMRAGIRVYQYQPGMMHAKMVLADHRFATVGSANVDVRSLALNFELNCVFYSSYEIRRVERIFDAAFENSRELGENYLKRRLPIRLVENFARLFSPAL